MTDLLGVFPHLNALLNATSGIFLILGLYFVRTKQVSRHRASMLTAASVSAVFLASYLTYHGIRTYYFGLGPTKFTGEGMIRPVYFTILTSHTVLAVVITPFILVTLWRGLKGDFEKHKRLARLVYPIWLYVSMTGVAVYLMLYQFYSAR